MSYIIQMKVITFNFSLCAYTFTKKKNSVLLKNVSYYNNDNIVNNGSFNYFV